MKIRKPIQQVPGLALLILCLLLFEGVFALDVPAIKARVNDYAAMLSSATRHQLENSLSAFEKAESTQIVVLTIPSLEGEPIENFSIRVADTWKIGQKGLDNGAILLISRNDRKLRIEVGYGLEGKLTDLISGRIIQQIIVPQFQTGNFDQGVINGVNAMMEAVKGEFKTPDKTTQPSNNGSSKHPLFFILIFFGFIIINLGRANRLLGTIAGGIMLPLFAAGLLSMAVLIPLGLIIGFILSLMGLKMGGSTSGRRTPLTGGFRGGSGGGFSSRGFGGFSGGGGGFGGGGASGGW